MSQTSAMGISLKLLLFGLAAASQPSQGPEYLYKAEGVKPETLESSETVAVSQTATAWLFKPTKAPKPVILIFCPGGLVEPTAYAPTVRSIAEQGYPVYLIKLGPKYDTLELQKKDGVAKIKEIVAAGSKAKFVIGGHSLGGAIAAQYAHENPALLNGLLLLGTTHPRDFDLSTLKQPVTKVYGSLDGIARKEHTENNKPKLPSHTQWVLIEGGNHGQFGYYGAQPGDPPAAISREKQQEIVLEETLKLLRTVASGK